jgi:hypothetical protein
VILGALAGGLVGTIVLTTGSRLAQQLGWTRMDIPLLLGTIFSAERGRAGAIGYAIHFANGLLFAVAYGLVFEATGRAGWLFGLLLNVLLPAVHPRMGKPWTDSRSTPVLEPPGFLLSNYGRATLGATFALHLVYGAIVGLFASL